MNSMTSPGSGGDLLQRFAQERRLDADVLARVWGLREVVHLRRPALRYPTGVGVDRVKFVDGAKPKAKWVASGGHAHWYGLDQALHLLSEPAVRPRLYVVNGEPSVWGAHLRHVPAVCMCVGESAASKAAELAPDLVAALGRLPRIVAVAVAFDCDAAGEEGGPEIAAALRRAGL